MELERVTPVGATLLRLCAAMRGTVFSKRSSKDFSPCMQDYAS